MPSARRRPLPRVLAWLAWLAWPAWLAGLACLPCLPGCGDDEGGVPDAPSASVDAGDADAEEGPAPDAALDAPAPRPDARPACTLGAWEIAPLDTVASLLQATAIGVAADNTAYALYYDGSLPPQVRLAIGRPGEAWTIEPVDVTDEFDAAGLALAIDAADGTVHVAHSVGDLWHASRAAGGTWSLLTVVSRAGDGAAGPALRAGPGGLAIAYAARVRSEIVLREGPAGGPFQDSVVRAGGSSADVVLSGAPGADLALAAYDITGRDLFFARRAAGAWEAGSIDGEGTVGGAPSLARAPDGSVHVTYYDFTNKDLKHAESATGAAPFALEVVAGAGGGDAGLDSALAVGADGTLHVLYYDALASALGYARRPPGEAWVLEAPVETEGTVGRAPSLAVAPDGSLHASYVDVTAGAVKVARRACE